MRPYAAGWSYEEASEKFSWLEWLRAHSDTEEEINDDSVDITLRDNVMDIGLGALDPDEKYTVIWVADAHLIADTSGNSEIDQGWIDRRMRTDGLSELANPLVGVTVNKLPTVAFANAIDEISKNMPDALVLGGDIMDACTSASVDFINTQLSKITCPIMHIKTDHEAYRL